MAAGATGGIAILLAVFGCEPCAAVAGILDALLWIGSGYVAFADDSGYDQGVFLEGYIPGGFWLWHN